MRKLIDTTILLLIPICVLISCNNLKNYQINNKEQMKNIHFIPDEFNDIKLGYHETFQNNCTLSFYDEMRTVNSITINTPKKIIYKSIDKEVFIPIIPLCSIYSISLRRGLKYHNLSAKILYIKNIDEGIIYSGEIIDRDIQYDHPLEEPFEKEREKERVKRIKEAQEYNDDELEQPGLAAINYININITEYVDIPFKPGKYEIYLSFSGLESNHTIVEIIEK